uniref:Uncharacterized protein n=1 Tax=Setaria viridis TaxID=4556 RepID=A0A4U6WGA1_SETVI|nr:hypothetical protein SEVIR_1G299850v2 [Setaria viridis]
MHMYLCVAFSVHLFSSRVLLSFLRSLNRHLALM